MNKQELQNKKQELIDEALEITANLLRNGARKTPVLTLTVQYRPRRGKGLATQVYSIECVGETWETNIGRLIDSIGQARIHDAYLAIFDNGMVGSSVQERLAAQQTSHPINTRDHRQALSEREKFLLDVKEIEDELDA